MPNLRRWDKTYVDPEIAPFFLAIAAGTLLLGSLVLYWRISKIRLAFGSGTTVAGRITKITAFKDRAYLHYRYILNGVEINAVHFIHLTNRAKSLCSGQEVLIAVDPAHPKGGFVTQLFTMPTTSTFPYQR